MRSVKRRIWTEIYLNDEPDSGNVWGTLNGIDVLCYRCIIEIKDKINGH